MNMKLIKQPMFQRALKDTKFLDKQIKICGVGEVRCYNKQATRVWHITDPKANHLALLFHNDELIVFIPPNSDDKEVYDAVTDRVEAVHYA